MADCIMRSRSERTNGSLYCASLLRNQTAIHPSPISAINCDMGCFPASVLSWKVVLGRWSRLVNMHDIRINKRIFIWAAQLQNVRFKDWNFYVHQFYLQHNIETFLTLM